MTEFEKTIREMAARHIESLRRKLQGMPLEQLLGVIRSIDAALAGRPSAGTATPGTSKASKGKAAPKRRPMTWTPKAIASRKLQGRYIGFLRKFDDKTKRLVRGIAKKAGVAAAVREMERRLGAAAKKPAPKAAKKAAKKISPGRKLQGVYIGYLRNFKGAERDRVRALAKTKGQAAAIAVMKKKLGRK